MDYRYIRLPDDNVQAIDISTVTLGNVHADWGKMEEDTAVAKFDNVHVLDYVMLLLTHEGIISSGKRSMELMVTSKLTDSA